MDKRLTTFEAVGKALNTLKTSGYLTKGIDKANQRTQL